ncbi:MAG: T9SS type A sorting domain-containing protein [Bacteroidota bacterium]
MAQTSPDPFGPCEGPSRGGALLLIPDAPAIEVLDAPLQPGDVLAAIAPDGSCVGQATWDGAGTALQVRADDPMTPVLDGLLDGDPVELAVWDRSADRIVEAAHVTPTFDEGLAPTAGFATDALFALARQAARPDVPEAAPVATLGEAYPNPASGRARIPFRLGAEADVTVEVFDTLGRSVAVALDGTLAAGEHAADFDASRVADGVYFYRLRAGGDVVQGQLVVTR